MERPEGSIIVKQLLIAGYTLEGIADKLKVSYSSVRAWLHDERKPSWLTYNAMSEMLKKGAKK